MPKCKVVVHDGKERVKEKEEEKERKKEMRVTEIYIAFKSLERLIIIVIISRNYRRKKTDTVRMRVCMRG